LDDPRCDGRASPAQAPDDAVHEESSRRSPTPDHAMSPTLLIVDDHGAFRSTARALLESDGWDVVGEAGDGSSGIEAALELRPDVVLLDVRLPDMDGFTVAERLTAGGGGPAVVVTSSSDDPLYVERAREMGARGFIPKHDLSGEALERIVG
jgi:DNA-binding NarL/FixJ family response regulator